jgi:hypothetical protein
VGNAVMLAVPGVMETGWRRCSKQAAELHRGARVAPGPNAALDYRSVVNRPTTPTEGR